MTRPDKRDVTLVKVSFGGSSIISRLPSPAYAHLCRTTQERTDKMLRICRGVEGRGSRQVHRNEKWFCIAVGHSVSEPWKAMSFGGNVERLR